MSDREGGQVSAYGKWSDGGLLALWNNSDTLFNATDSMLLFTNDVTPASGFTYSSLGFLLAIDAYASRPVPWSLPTLAASGDVRRTTSSPWSFGFNPSLPDTLAYGFGLFHTLSSSSVLYAERFADAPRTVNGSTILAITPNLDLHNNDSTPPVTDVIPPGTIAWLGTTTIPSGWLLCDGSTKVQASYPNLYAAIGTTFGPATGGNFTLPDLRGRGPIGNGTGSGLSARTLAATGGEENHLLTTGEMPSHSHANLGGGGFAIHSPTTPTYALSVAGSGNNFRDQTATDTSGGGGTHNNMQPFLVLVPIIKT